MKALPVIIGFGGINAAGRSSYHQGFERMVFDALTQAQQKECEQGLSVLMRNSTDRTLTRDEVLAGTLVRRIEPVHFDVDRAVSHKKMTLNKKGEAFQFTLSKKDLPATIPEHWALTSNSDGSVTVTTHQPGEFLIQDQQSYPVKAAGQVPAGFNPGNTYNSRNHPRGLQLAVYAASDALRSSGLDWNTVLDTVAPEKICVYASSAMGQLDEMGSGGMLRSNLQGKRVSSKQCPMGFPDMTANFINAYMLGNIGSTGAMVGACATFLYNLQKAVEDIQSGQAQIVFVGASEAPILQEVMEGYRAMSTLAEDEGLSKLDGNNGPVDHRRACRPFANNCGFTIAESSQFFMVCSDELAMELGATVYGAVPSVYVHADGIKRSISAPGVGNYLTVGQALNDLQQALGSVGGLKRSFVMAHGTGTPQNRVTESHILNELALAFGIEHWPVAAVKCFLGHSIGVAGGDQLSAALGALHHQIIPGITTSTSFADDVHRSNLLLSNQHQQFEKNHYQGALINAKGFGGNNASAVLLSQHWCHDFLQNRYSSAQWTAYQQKQDAIIERQIEYKDRVLTEIPPSIYRFGEPEIEGEQLQISREQISVPGYSIPISFNNPFPY